MNKQMQLKSPNTLLPGIKSLASMKIIAMNMEAQNTNFTSPTINLKSKKKKEKNYVRSGVLRLVK